jgi:hypothetical protein
LIIAGIAMQRHFLKKQRLRNRRKWGVVGFSSHIAARCCAILSHFPSERGNSYYGRAFLVRSIILSHILKFEDLDLLGCGAACLGETFSKFRSRLVAASRAMPLDPWSWRPYVLPKRQELPTHRQSFTS